MASIFNFNSTPKVPYDSTIPVKHPLKENKIPVKDSTYWFKLTKKRWFNDWHELNAQERAILCSLWLFSGSKRSCYPSITKLASVVKINRNNTIRHLRFLESKGFIVVKKTAGKPNCYSLLR